MLPKETLKSLRDRYVRLQLMCPGVGISRLDSKQTLNDDPKETLNCHGRDMNSKSEMTGSFLCGEGGRK